MKFNITGKNLIELQKEYGIGGSGLYSNWWKDELFAKEKPKPGVYEIDFENTLFNNTLFNLPFKKQLEKLPKGFKPVHPAVLTEAILSHYKKTGERLLEKWYSRTDTLVSDGFRVRIGRFDSNGLLVDDYSDDGYYDNLGLAAARKCGDLKLESLSLNEALPLELNINGIVYIKK